MFVKISLLHVALVELSILKATLNCCKAVWLRFKVGISFFELTHFCLKIRRRLFREGAADVRRWRARGEDDIRS